MNHIDTNKLLQNFPCIVNQLLLVFLDEQRSFLSEEGLINVLLIKCRVLAAFLGLC